RHVAHERIRPPFLAKIAVRTVSGKENRVVAERPQLLRDRIKQLLVVAAREIGAADRPLEQDVADDRELRGAMIEDDMPGRMPRGVNDLDREIAHPYRVAIAKPAVGLEGLARHAEARTVLAEPLDPETIVLVGPLDGHPEFLREHARLPAMVHVTVGDEDLLDLDARLPHRVLELVEVPAGVDEGGLVRLGAPEQSAILLKGGDGDDGG